MQNWSEGQPDTMNAFELQRKKRIERNRQVLCELGLENAAQQMIPPKPKASRRKQPDTERQKLEPSRKSRRLQGGKPEFELSRR